MINIYYIGNSQSLISNIFFYFLKKFVIQNKHIQIKKIIDTNSSFDNEKFIYLKDYIKLTLYFFFNKKYFSIFKHYLKNKKKFYCLTKNETKEMYIKYNKDFNVRKIKKSNSVLISVGCNKILSKQFLKSFSYNINYHHAELPSYRGVNSNGLSLLNNKKFTAFCFHFLGEEIDNGFVFIKKKIKIKYNILNNIFYDILKIKVMSRSIDLIFNKMLDNKTKRSYKFKVSKSYYDKNYIKNLLDTPTKFNFTEIKKLIDIFGHMRINNMNVTKIKKNKKGIRIKNGYIKILQINYMPILLYRVYKILNLNFK